MSSKEDATRLADFLRSPPFFAGRIAELREDGACLIGLKRYASVALLGYDLFLNVFVSSRLFSSFLGSSPSRAICSP